MQGQEIREEGKGRHAKRESREIYKIGICLAWNMWYNQESGGILIRNGKGAADVRDSAITFS